MKIPQPSRTTNRTIEIVTSLLIIVILNSCQSYNDKVDKKLDTSQSLSISKTNKTADLNVNQIDSLTKEADQFAKDKLLKKYYFPEMSFCGGGLDGYYKDSTLIIIDATYKAELGFSSRKMYWNKGEIIKIIYRQHYADWDKYIMDYPKDKFEWDPSKVTYTDTVYTITLGAEYLMRKTADEKLISEKKDSNLIQRLINCGLDMKMELETEKELKI